MGLFGPEKMSIFLDRYDYRPGEKITGRVKLNLKKPVDARKLEVRLYGIQMSRQGGRSVGSGSTVNRDTGRTIYDFKIPISGEKTYHKDEYNFEIKIPLDIYDPTAAQIGETGRVIMQTIKALANIRVDWFVQVDLNVPKRIDIRKRQKVIISSE
jgi:hypothetical protein